MSKPRDAFTCVHRERIFLFCDYFNGTIASDYFVEALVIHDETASWECVACEWFSEVFVALRALLLSRVNNAGCARDNLHVGERKRNLQLGWMG